jgi:hypothetical protein
MLQYSEALLMKSSNLLMYFIKDLEMSTKYQLYLVNYCVTGKKWSEKNDRNPFSFG